MAQAVLKGETGRVPRPRDLDLPQQLRAVVGMDSLEPVLRLAADFMVFTTDERDPSGGKMDPIGFQIPVPEPLAVTASALATAAARARTSLIHA